MSSSGLRPVTPNTSSAACLMMVARGSKFLYTRWPNPIKRSSPVLTRAM